MPLKKVNKKEKSESITDMSDAGINQVKPKKKLNAYQQYVKDNYQRVKSKMLGGTSKDIISTLAFEYQAFKNKKVKKTYDNKSLNF
jgi:hypothetical protein